MASELSKSAAGSDSLSQEVGHDEHHGSVSGRPFAWGDGSAPSLPSADDEESQNGNDYDSAISGLSDATSTTSLRSSIYQRVEENGRTYHRFRQGKYPLPNDEQEQERLYLQHIVFGKTLSGELYLAPIVNPENVLDIGTGTGIWAIDFAHQHPAATVIGTDLSPIQPLHVPPNCRFEIDDAEDEWVFNEPFDYIHGRALVSCFADPKSVLTQAFKSLTPGGYLEMQDGLFPCKYIGDPPTDSALYKWGELVVQGAGKTGRPWISSGNYARWMREIGFEDVVEKNFYWPTSPWPKGKYFKEIAVYFQEDLLNGLEGLSLKVMGLLGWSAEDIKAFLPAVRDDIKNTSIHAYFPIVVVYGRKPLSAH